MEWFTEILRQHSKYSQEISFINEVKRWVNQSLNSKKSKITTKISTNKRMTRQQLHEI